ncbi:transcriptional regulator GcvA [Pacificispira sp.]|uniref:transcriptional regulator GcvA n=1 Tax=Pacificispira sp. TaxID=2888761 RepID=UPI003BAA402A
MPSLSALRAFEAAARHGSFRSAADELNVTHSAISHQVKALEENLGVPLFSRGGRAVRLTEEGRILFPVLREAFDGIVAGTDLLRRRQSGGTLTVQVYVTLAVRWLLPRLHGFAKAHNEVQVALATSYTDWDFARGEVDAAILFVEHRHADLDYTPLGKARLFPVCAPSLLENGPRLREPADLRAHRLLNVYPAKHDWPDWLAAAGVTDLEPDLAGPRFDSYLLALEEAAAGGGVSLTTQAFVADDLARGRLVIPFDLKVDSRAPWYLVCAKERRNEPRIVKFRNWLLETVGNEPDGSGFE